MSSLDLVSTNSPRFPRFLRFFICSERVVNPRWLSCLALREGAAFRAEPPAMREGPIFFHAGPIFPRLGGKGCLEGVFGTPTRPGSLQPLAFPGNRKGTPRLHERLMVRLVSAWVVRPRSLERGLLASLLRVVGMLKVTGKTVFSSVVESFQSYRVRFRPDRSVPDRSVTTVAPGGAVLLFEKTSNARCWEPLNSEALRGTCGKGS